MIIKNKTLVDLLIKKGALIDDARAISKKIEELENDRRKVGLQVQKLKDKIIPLVHKETKDLLGEYEEISEVEPKDGEVIIKTVDVLENFKRDYKEARAKAEEK